MARIAGVDIPKTKKIGTALTYIYGIGPTGANRILEAAGSHCPVHRSLHPDVETPLTFEYA